MKFTNYSQSKQGIHAQGKRVYVEPGQEVDLDLTPEEKARMKKHPAFMKEGQEVQDEPHTDDDGGEDGATEVGKMKKPDVIAELEQRGYEVDKSAPVADLRAELEKARDEDK